MCPICWINGLIEWLFKPLRSFVLLMVFFLTITIYANTVPIELELVFLSFDKKMKKELIKGKKIKVDKIGKFILI